MKRDLYIGSRDSLYDSEVSVLQKYLGISPSTGYFGNITFSYVKDFQKKNGINISGSVGSTTREKIKKLTCSSQSSSNPPFISNFTISDTNKKDISKSGYSGYIESTYKTSFKKDLGTNVIFNLKNTLSTSLGVYDEGFWIVKAVCEEGVTFSSDISGLECGKFVRLSNVVKKNNTFESIFSALVKNSSKTRKNFYIVVYAYTKKPEMVGYSTTVVGIDPTIKETPIVTYKTGSLVDLNKINLKNISLDIDTGLKIEPTSDFSLKAGQYSEIYFKAGFSDPNAVIPYSGGVFQIDVANDSSLPKGMKKKSVIQVTSCSSGYANCKPNSISNDTVMIFGTPEFGGIFPIKINARYEIPTSTCKTYPCSLPTVFTSMGNKDVDLVVSKGTNIYEASMNSIALIDGLTISPKEIVSDSRCSTDVTCFWAGTVEVKALVYSNTNRNTFNFKLNNPVSTEFGIITLTGVKPDRGKSSDIINPDDYKFSFSVTK